MGGGTLDGVGGTPSVGKERRQPHSRTKRNLPLSRFDRNAPESALSEVLVFDHALTKTRAENNGLEARLALCLQRTKPQ
jgi:hypothetical protein